MSQPNKAATPIWAWFVLVFGAIFLVTMVPVLIILLLLPFFKPEETSIVSIFFTLFGVAMVAAAFWGMAKAYQAIKFHRKIQKEQEVLFDQNDQAGEISGTEQTAAKPVWPWIVIVPGAALIVMSGPGALMFPIMPLFLAGMSTDSGQTPDYVPALIILIGYGLMFGYAILVVMAIKALRRGRQNLKKSVE